MTGNDGSPDTGIDRRRLMQLSGAGLAAALAGCSGGDGGDGGGDGGDGGSDGGDGGGGDGGGDGGGGGSEQKEVHILTDYTSKAWQDRWENTLVPGFQEQNPNVTVNVEYTGMQGNAMQRLTTLLQSGDPPNSFQSTPDTVTPLHLQGQTIPTSDLVSTLEGKHGKIKGLSAVQWDGETWTVPHGIYYEQVFQYRRDIYETLGISEAPTTWNDVLDNAKAIDNDSDIQARGYGLAGVKAGKTSNEFNVLYATNNARLLEWKNKDEGIGQLWFPEDKAVETLSYMEQLAQYSPDPTSISWGPALSFWAGGRMAQQGHLNAWPAGVAASAGADAIAKGSDIAVMPHNDGVDPADRGFTELDGATLLDAPAAAETKDFFEYMYRDKANVAANHAMEPTRFIPIYEGFTETEEYQSIEMFQKYDGHILDLNQKVVRVNEGEMNSPKRVQNLQSNYIGRFPILAEMVNQVIVQGRNKTDAYREARDRLESRLKEVNEKLGISG